MKRDLTPTQLVIRAEILRRLEEGESLRAICRTEGFPSASSVLAWRDNETEEGGFSEQYARARKIGYALLAEELLDVARNARRGVVTKTVRKIVDGKEEVEETETESDAVDRSKLHYDALRWTLSKMLPKVYGDKIAHEVGGVDGGSIKTENVNVTVPLDPIEASKIYQDIIRRE